MGIEWVDHSAWQMVHQASEATGRDVAELLLNADVDTLTRTDNAQLSTFVLSAIVQDAISQLALFPNIVAGHSLGEFSALRASGVLSFDDGCRVVVARGNAMASAAELRDGTMYAIIGLSSDDVIHACNDVGGDAWVANFNADGQIVVAGSREALENVAKVAKEMGAKRALPLPVGGAFHTPFMEPAARQFAEALQNITFGKLHTPIVANIDGELRDTSTDWQRHMQQQMLAPVQWTQTTKTLLACTTTALIEVGPGAVLTGLAKRNAPDALAFSVSTPHDIEKLHELLSANGNQTRT